MATGAFQLLFNYYSIVIFYFIRDWGFNGLKSGSVYFEDVGIHFQFRLPRNLPSIYWFPTAFSSLIDVAGRSSFLTVEGGRFSSTG